MQNQMYHTLALKVQHTYQTLNMTLHKRIFDTKELSKDIKNTENFFFFMSIQSTICLFRNSINILLRMINIQSELCLLLLLLLKSDHFFFQVFLFIYLFYTFKSRGKNAISWLFLLLLRSWGLWWILLNRMYIRLRWRLRM